MNPKVSVVIPVYNSELFIAEAIESVLNQTYNNIELIVVNDCSTDKTADILNNYSGKINIITNERNIGVSLSRNRGLSEMTGEYFAPLDADDVCLPYRLSKGVEFLQSNKSCVLVGGQVSYIDSHSKCLGTSNYPTTEEEVTAHIWRRNPIAHSSLLARAELVKSLGMYDSSLEVCEDYDLLFRLLRHGYLANLSEVVVKYRLHDSQLTQCKYATLLKTTVFLQNKYKNLYNHKDNFVDGVYACGYWFLLKTPSKASNRIVNFFRKLARYLGVLRRRFYD